MPQKYYFSSRGEGKKNRHQRMTDAGWKSIADPGWNVVVDSGSEIIADRGWIDVADPVSVVVADRGPRN